jgi:hypothetical protein
MSDFESMEAECPDCAFKDAEIERLREALERIATGCAVGSQVVAREALEADDE